MTLWPTRSTAGSRTIRAGRGTGTRSCPSSRCAARCSAQRRAARGGQGRAWGGRAEAGQQRTRRTPYSSLVLAPAKAAPDPPCRRTLLSTNCCRSCSCWPTPSPLPSTCGAPSRITMPCPLCGTASPTSSAPLLFLPFHTFLYRSSRFEGCAGKPARRADACLLGKRPAGRPVLTCLASACPPPRGAAASACWLAMAASPSSPQYSPW